MPPIVLILPKKDAVEAARAATAHTRVPTDALVLHLFCDASYKRGNAIRKTKPGAALAVVANISMPRATKNQRTSKACFIPSNDPGDSSLTAEAFALAEGVYVALDTIARMEADSAIGPTDRIEILLWSDCQHVLKELGYEVRTPRHTQRLRHIIDIIELKTRELQRSRENVSVQFLWCPEECVEPHRTADELSKRVRIAGGSGAKSKALHLFDRLPHRAIQSALAQPYMDASQSETDHGEADQGQADQGQADQGQADQGQADQGQADQGEADPSDNYQSDNYQSDGDQNDGDQNKDHLSNDVQSHDDHSEPDRSETDQSTGAFIPATDGYAMLRAAVVQLPPAYMEVMLAAIELQEMVNALMKENQTRNQVQDSEGQDREQEGFSDEDEDQFYDAQEGQHAIAADGEARSSRMRTLWDWVRGRPRL